MDASAVFTEVEIPFKAFGITDLVHLGFEDVITFLALRTADDLSFARDETIAGSNSLPVVILPHVEGFDFLRIVDEEQRSFNHFFGQIAFVFGTEVLSPEEIGRASCRERV